MTNFETQSPSIGELAKALAKAQAVMPVAIKSKENPFFKSQYADLPALVHVTRKCLTDNGLSVSQVTIPENGVAILKTLLMHSSGEWLASFYPVHPVKNDPQSLGSAISYARRYSYAPAIGLVSDDAEDDDGNAASGKMAQSTPQPRQALPAVKHAQPHPSAPISSQEPGDLIPALPGGRGVSELQIKRMYALMHKADWGPEETDSYLEKAWGFKNKTMLNKKQYDHVCGLLEKQVPFSDAWDRLLESLAARV